MADQQKKQQQGRFYTSDCGHRFSIPNIKRHVVVNKNINCPTCGEQIGFITKDSQDNDVYNVGNRHKNPDNSLGGWVSITSKVGKNVIIKRNAKVWGDSKVNGRAQIYGRAQVYGRAEVSGNAVIYGDAEVYDHAMVYGNAEVYDDAKIYGYAEVYGYSRIYSSATVYGHAEVYDYARVDGNAMVYDHVFIYGRAWVRGDAKIYGNGEARVYGDAVVCGNAQVYGSAKIYGNARVYEHAQIYGIARVYGNAHIGGNARIDSGEYQSAQQQERAILGLRTRRTQQQQSRRRTDFRQKMGGRMTPGLQGRGREHFEKFSQKQQQWEDVPQQITDPITRDILEDPVIANDGLIYSKSTIERMKSSRGVSGIQITSIKTPNTQQSRKIQNLLSKIKQFKQTHQKDPDTLGRYKRKQQKKKPQEKQQQKKQESKQKSV